MSDLASSLNDQWNLKPTLRFTPSSKIHMFIGIVTQASCTVALMNLRQPIQFYHFRINPLIVDSVARSRVLTNERNADIFSLALAWNFSFHRGLRDF